MLKEELFHSKTFHVFPRSPSALVTGLESRSTSITLHQLIGSRGVFVYTSTISTQPGQLLGHCATHFPRPPNLQLRGRLVLDFEKII